MVDRVALVIFYIPTIRKDSVDLRNSHNTKAKRSSLAAIVLYTAPPDGVSDYGTHHGPTLETLYRDIQHWGKDFLFGCIRAAQKYVARWTLGLHLIYTNMVGRDFGEVFLEESPPGSFVWFCRLCFSSEEILWFIAGCRSGTACLDSVLCIWWIGFGGSFYYFDGFVFSKHCVQCVDSVFLHRLLLP
jgi:hypothetical protein